MSGKSFKQYLNEHKWFILMLLLFGIVFFLISIFNHLNFRTGSSMMGTYLNAIYDYLNFGLPEVNKAGPVSFAILAMEFDLYLILLSPFSLLFGSYTLLIIQVLAILFGAFGVYRYLNLISSYRWIPFLGSLHFLLFFGIYAALYADYNSMLVAIMFIPWFFYSFKKEDYNRSFLFLLLMIMARETMGLILAFIFLGMIFEYFRDKKATSKLVIYALLSYLYFLVVSGMIMPSMAQADSQPAFSYSFIGENMMDAFSFILFHPIASINFLMVNHTGNPAFNDIKKEFIIFFLFSGGVLLIMRFRYLFMMTPIFFLMLLHNKPEQWSVFSSFSALFAPILSIGLFNYFSRIGNPRHRVFLITTTLLTTAAVSLMMMTKTRYPGDRDKIAIFARDHYTRSVLPDSVYHHLDMIPARAAVSSQSDFLPHLAMREQIHTFPDIRNVDYIVADENIAKEKGDREVLIFLSELTISPDWEVLLKDKGFYIFKSGSEEKTSEDKK